MIIDELSALEGTVLGGGMQAAGNPNHFVPGPLLEGERVISSLCFIKSTEESEVPEQAHVYSRPRGPRFKDSTE